MIHQKQPDTVPYADTVPYIDFTRIGAVKWNARCLLKGYMARTQDELPWSADFQKWRAEWIKACLDLIPRERQFHRETVDARAVVRHFLKVRDRHAHSVSGL